MCFSAEASFTAATALLPVGVYCVIRAVREDKRLVALALVPVAFAIQQAAEGCVWHGLQYDNPLLVQMATASFLFFAVAFWPFWVPFSLRFVERRRPAQVFLDVTTALSITWLGFYVFAVIFPGRVLHAHVVHHSIDYGLADLHGFREVPLIVWQLAYLAFICGPLLLTRTSGGATFWHSCGGVVAVLFVVSDLVYWYAFASIWCFFAAASSLLLALAFARLPAPGGEISRSVPARTPAGLPLLPSPPIGHQTRA